MKDIISQILTGKDNQTNDIARWSWLISLAVVIGLAIYEVMNHAGFSIREFAESVGIISGAHGAAVMMKKDTEPQ